MVYSERARLTISYEFSTTEVIASPGDILLCDDLKGGWLGTWNPNIPDGVKDSFTLNRTIIGDTNKQRTFLLGQGESWVVGSSPILIDKNSTTGQSYPAGSIQIINYLSKAVLTENSVNKNIYGGKNGLGDLFASSDGYSAYGARGRLLKYSLTGKVRGTVAYASGGVQNSIFTNYGFIDDNTLLPTLRDAYNLKHPEIVIDGSEGVHAFKAVNYNVVVNQQGFVSYAYAQLHYDTVAGDWGDDRIIHIVNNQTTMPDENFNSVFVGMAACVESIGWIKNDI